MKTSSSTLIRVEKRYTFSSEEILGALRAQGLLPARSPYGTTNEKVFISIPGGGDWSNTDLDVSDEDPLRVHIVTNTQESGA